MIKHSERVNNKPHLNFEVLEEQSNLCLSLPSAAAYLSFYMGLGLQLNKTDITKTYSQVADKVYRNPPSYWQSKAECSKRIDMRSYPVFSLNKSF